MPKRLTSTTIAHTDDATFRTWLNELSDGLVAVGLVRASDTGQINRATATRPSTNTSAGYEIFYLNDSLHATAPIYIRIEYRTGSSADIPNWSIGIGTGTDGAGTLTGLVQAQMIITRADGAIVGTARNSLFTGGAGYFGVVFKAGAKFSGAMDLGQFFLARAVDSAGALLTTGYSFMTQESSNGGTINFRSAIFSSGGSFLPAAGITNSNQIGPVYSASATLTSGQYQAMRVQCAIPLYDHAYGMLAVVPAEVSGLTIFPATIQGGSKNFIAWPTASSIAGASVASMRMCMMWQGSDV